MPIDSKTKERIASDAKIHFRNDSIGQSIIDTLRRGYIAGAEAEAERAQPVIDALKQGEIDRYRSAMEQILRTNYDNHEKVIEKVKIIATEALKTNTHG